MARVSTNCGPGAGVSMAFLMAICRIFTGRLCRMVNHFGELGEANYEDILNLEEGMV